MNDRKKPLFGVGQYVIQKSSGEIVKLSRRNFTHGWGWCYWQGSDSTGWEEKALRSLTKREAGR